MERKPTPILELTHPKLLEYPLGVVGLKRQPVPHRGIGQMNEFPTAGIVFLSGLFRESSESRLNATRFLNKKEDAATARDHLATMLNLTENPQVLVLDLAGFAYTPAALQELILPLAQRIRGGEHGIVRLVITTTDPGVGDFIRYMAHTHQLPLYLSHSPFDLREGNPVGALTETEKGTLDTINVLGGRVTASQLAMKEGIRPSAATNRLVNLHREGYLVRHQRGRREGDLYFEPRSATSTPMKISPITTAPT